MVKLKGPALSLDASGSIAKAVTLAKNTGRNYMRKLSKPANPKTQRQIAARAAMRFCSETWGTLIPTFKDQWNAAAEHLTISGFNHYVAVNTNRIYRDEGPTWLPLPDPTQTVASGFAWSMTASVRTITYGFNPSGSINATWGCFIYQDPITFTTALPYQIVGFIVNANPTPLFWFISPLPSQLYWARIRMFTKRGVIGSQSALRSATPLP